jgi:hypothetical protein
MEQQNEAELITWDNAAPLGLERHTKEHELWLAMQTAHEHYRAALAALENSIPENDCSNEDSNNASKPGGERSAFEAYIEARLQFMEFMIDHSNSTRMGIVGSLDEVVSASNRRIPRVVALIVGMIVVLSVCAFGYFSERRMLHDLNRKNREMDSLLRVTTLDVKHLGASVSSLQHNLTSVREQGSFAPLVSGTHHWKRLAAYPRRRKQVASAHFNGLSAFVSQPKRRRNPPPAPLKASLQPHGDRSSRDPRFSTREDRQSPAGLGQ